MSTKTYTVAEIATHNSKKSNWVLIRDSVYDVTQFMDEHPGGEEVLLEQGGKNATEAFEDVGHSGDARELMIKYKIGELVPEERKNLKDVPEKKLEWAPKPAKKTDNEWPIWLWVVLAIVPIIVYQLFFTGSSSPAPST